MAIHMLKPPHRKREFGGKTYSHSASASTKAEADKQATMWRDTHKL